MKWLNPFRVSAVLLTLFCAAHTVGGMFLQKSLGADADMVFSQMKNVHFNFNGADVTYYGFWFGFGLTASIFLLLSAVISWRLAAVESKDWSVVSVIAWALILSHIANTYLSFRYFFVGPGIFGSLVSLLMIVGAVAKSRGNPTPG
jgi:hypothetical protein